MNKKLFTLITIFILTLSTCFSFEVKAVDQKAIDEKAKAAAAALEAKKQDKGVVDKAIDIVTPEKGSLLAALIPSQKNCNYVDKKLYEPFSNIDEKFPGASALGLEKSTEDPNVTCINVAGGTEALLKMLFTVAISVIIILTVINISIAGIQYMTQEAAGKKGEAKKRLQNSLIALALGLMSYTILYTVNKQLVSFEFNPGGIDKDGSIDKGIARGSQDVGTFSTNIQVLSPVLNAYNQPGQPNQTLPGSPYLIPGSTPTFAETTAIGNTTSSYNNGEIVCSGTRCSSKQSTVFGFSDGDGQNVSGGSDNGIGNESYSDIIGCAVDTGHPDQLSNPTVATQGVALPTSFWASVGFSTTDARLAGVKISKPDGTILGIFPVVDNSSKKLDFTFGLVKYRVGQYDTVAAKSVNSNSWSGSGYSFEIIKDYYRTTPKQNITYGNNMFTDGKGIRRSILGSGPNYSRQTQYTEPCTSTRKK